MTKDEKSMVRRIYDAIRSGETVLGFDEKRGVGIISLVDHRREATKLMPAAEIRFPLVSPIAIPE